MLTLLVCICIIAAVVVGDEDDCPSRKQCSDCVLHYLDSDGMLTLNEIKEIRREYLTWYERAFAWILSESPERMIELCDADGDGMISQEDFDKTADTCLAECTKRLIFYNKICEPAKLRKKLEEEMKNKID